MHRITRIKGKSATTAVIVLLLASLGLAACGGSSKSSSTSASAAAAPSASGGATGPNSGASGPNGGRFAALRACLQKNGITLPKRTPGQGPRPGGGLFLGGGEAALPKGVTRAQYLAALRTCGGSAFESRGLRFQTRSLKRALTALASCMRKNGVKIPPANTSGKGPIFNTKGLNPASAQFKAAEEKCSAELQRVLRRRPGAAQGPGAGGAAGPPGTGAPGAGGAPGAELPPVG
jgi:hypothetical protein